MSAAATAYEYNLAREIAILDGMTVVVGEPNRLLLDIDTAQRLAYYQGFADRVAEAIGGMREIERWTSKSGIGTHVVIETLKPFTATQRLVIQAALGSDSLREVLGLALIADGLAEPSMLFRPKVTP